MKILNVVYFFQQTEETVSLMSELAEVVAQEKLLVDECHELLRNISNLEVNFNYELQNE